MVFLLQFLNMVYHIDSFAYIEESMHSWDKPHLRFVLCVHPEVWDREGGRERQGRGDLGIFVYV